MAEHHNRAYSISKAAERYLIDRSHDEMVHTLWLDNGQLIVFGGKMDHTYQQTKKSPRWNWKSCINKNCDSYAKEYEEGPMQYHQNGKKNLKNAHGSPENA